DRFGARCVPRPRPCRRSAVHSTGNGRCTRDRRHRCIAHRRKFPWAQTGRCRARRIARFRGGSMILVFDVGNTETTIGLFNGDVLRGHWRIITGIARTGDEYGILIRSLLTGGEFDPSRVDGVAIGSVVPAVTAPLADACARYLPVSSSIIVAAKAGLPITLDVDEPLTVGADRIINTLAASRLFARDCVVVDLGTATTFDCITAGG